MLEVKRLKQNKFEYKDYAKIIMESYMTTGRRGGKRKEYRYKTIFFYGDQYIELNSPSRYKTFKEMKASAEVSFDIRNRQMEKSGMRLN